MNHIMILRFHVIWFFFQRRWKNNQITLNRIRSTESYHGKKIEEAYHFRRRIISRKIKFNVIERKFKESCHVESCHVQRRWIKFNVVERKPDTRIVSGVQNHIMLRKLKNHMNLEEESYHVGRRERILWCYENESHHVGSYQEDRIVSH